MNIEHTGYKRVERLGEKSSSHNSYLEKDQQVSLLVRYLEGRIHTCVPRLSLNNMHQPLDDPPVLVTNSVHPPADGVVTMDSLSKEELADFQAQLSDHSSDVRLKTLTLLKDRLPQHEEFIDACLVAEKAEASPLYYRQKLQYLMAVGAKVATTQNDMVAELGFSFLLGSLYVNFTLLWKPIQDMLAQCLDNTTFSIIFRDQMVQKLKDINEKYILSGSSLDVMPAQRGQSKTRNMINDRPDHVTFTVNLLQVFTRKASLFEPVNPELTPIFLQLLNKDEEPEPEIIIDEDVVEEDGDEKAEAEKEPKKLDQSITKPVKTFDSEDRWRVVSALLDLFAQFKNPKRLFRCDEIQDKFMELLSDPRPSIQEKVFRCIITNDRSFPKSYQPYIFSLLKEETFKDAMADFDINAQNEEDRVLRDTDRGQVMPILLRILYGRMKCRTANKRLKSASQVKRQLVMRFISGCSEQEVLFFMDLIFESIKPLMQLSLDDVVTRMSIPENVRTISSFKMHANYKNILSIFEHFSSVTPLIRLFFKILLIICLWVHAMIQYKESMKQHVLPEIKHLRKNCITLLTTFFSQHEDYQFEKIEIDIMFKTMIHPNTTQLQVEGISGISSLLKLFVCWSDYTHYYPLFDYALEGNDKPISVIANILKNRKTPAVVANEVLNIFANLLSGYEETDELESEEAANVKKRFALPIEGKTDGSLILAPHIRIVMTYYANKLKTRTRNTVVKEKRKNRKPPLNNRDLSILSGVTMVTKEQSDALFLAKLLINVFRCQYMPYSEISAQHLAAISKLSDNCGPDRSSLLAPLCQVFHFVLEPSLRSDLAKLVDKFASDVPELRKMTRAIALMNARSRTSVNDPDYDKVFTGFKKFSEALNDLTIVNLTGEVLKVAAYTCFHYILHIDDQGVRSLSVSLLDKLIETISRSEEKSNHLFHDICIRIILKRGVMNALKNGNDVTRSEFLEVLISLMKHASQKHSLLQEFALLQDSNVDKDFWRNISHIQSHRRARAFTRLAQNESLLSQLSQEVLWNYLIPLCEPYIVTSGKKPEPALVSGSIEFLAAASKQLDYKLYEVLLKRYLNLLTKEPNHLNNVVQAISKILSNFNYDLSNATGRLEEKSVHEKKKALKHSQEKQREQQEQQRSGIEVENKAQEFKSSHVEEETVTREHDLEEDHETVSRESKGGQDDDGTEVIREKRETEETTVTTGAKGKQQVKKKKQLPAGEAALIFSSITSNLLPGLRKCIFDVSLVDYDQDRIKKRLDDSDEVQRIPISIALVKLLTLMPEETNLLRDNLTGILLRMCHFLRSRSDSIRRVARRSLKIITQDLGFTYLPQILMELKNGLTKGFQRHVLSFTIHYLLVNMGNKIEAGSLDNLFPMLMDVCVEDLFGDVAHEKEVQEMKGKLEEGKKSKSYDMMLLMGRVCGEQAIILLMQRLKEVLSGLRTYGDVKKISLCLDNLITGLSENEHLSMKTLCTLIYGIAKELIPQLQTPNASQEVVKDMKKRLRTDCLLIKDLKPKHKQHHSLSSSSSHMHLLIEKGFYLLSTLLKKRKFSDKSAGDMMSLLDPFVSILSDYLASKHVRLVCNVMKCLDHLVKEFTTLPSLQKEGEAIRNRLFVMMSETGTLSSPDPEIRMQSLLAFQCVSQLILHIPSSGELSDDQLIVLLSYIDQDLTDGSCKPVSFVLLNAIMQRGLHAKQLDSMMLKIGELAIQSEVDEIRNRCCKAWTSYLLNYSHGRHLKSHLLFFLRQLEYEYETGRRSAIQIVSSYVRCLPVHVIQPLQELILLPLACRLMNEDSISCRKQIFQLIKELVTRVDEKSRDRIWDQVVQPLLLHQDEEEEAEKDVKQQMLSLHLLSIFREVEKGFLEKRVPIFFARLVNSLKATARRSGSVKEEGERKDEEEGDREEMDRLIFQRLSLLREILVATRSELVRNSGKDNANNNSKRNNKNSSLKEKRETLKREMDELWPLLATFYLSFPHSWVRLITVQVFGHLFSLYSPCELANSVLSSSHEAASSDEYLVREAKTALPLLLQTFVLLFQTTAHDLQPLAQQLLHNLAFIGKVMISLDRQMHHQEDGSGPVLETLPKGLLLSNYLNKVLNMMRLEVRKHPGSIFIRKHVLKLVALVVVDMDQRQLKNVLHQILLPVGREVTDPRNRETRNREELMLLSQQVLDVIKSLVGDQCFNESYANALQILRKRRLTMKRERTLDLVLRPEKRIRLKQAKQARMKENRKRKRAHKKGFVVSKRRRLLA